MTPAQCQTIDYLEAIASETGATVACDEYDIGTDGALVVCETASAAWDHERTIWTLDRDGGLTIW